MENRNPLEELYQAPEPKDFPRANLSTIEHFNKIAESVTRNKETVKEERVRVSKLSSQNYVAKQKEKKEGIHSFIEKQNKQNLDIFLKDYNDKVGTINRSELIDLILTDFFKTHKTAQSFEYARKK